MKMKWLTIESLWHIEDLVVSSKLYEAGHQDDPLLNDG